MPLHLFRGDSSALGLPLDTRVACADADAIRRVMREALNEGIERRSLSGDADRLAERGSMETEDSLDNDYLNWY